LVRCVEGKVLTPQIADDSRRLSILTLQEIEDLYGLPRFAEEDRLAYFDLSEAERRMIDFRTMSVAVHLTL
jgi:hypothetical protein